MKCERDNPDGSRCGGEIVDGYCDECGMAPATPRPEADPSVRSPTVMSPGTTSANAVLADATNGVER